MAPYSKEEEREGVLGWSGVCEEWSGRREGAKDKSFTRRSVNESPPSSLIRLGREERERGRGTIPHFRQGEDEGDEREIERRERERETKRSPTNELWLTRGLTAG